MESKLKQLILHGSNGGFQSGIFAGDESLVLHGDAHVVGYIKNK